MSNNLSIKVTEKSKEMYFKRNEDRQKLAPNTNYKVTKTKVPPTFAKFVTKVVDDIPNTIMCRRYIAPREVNDPFAVLYKNGLLNIEPKSAIVPKLDAKGSDVDITFFREESQLGEVVKIFSSNHRFQNGRLVFSSTQELAPEVGEGIAKFRKWWGKLMGKKSAIPRLEVATPKIRRTREKTKSPSTRRRLADLFKEMKRDEIIRRYQSASRKSLRALRPFKSQYMEIPYRKEYKADEARNLRDLAMQRYLERFHPERLQDAIKTVKEYNSKVRTRGNTRKLLAHFQQPHDCLNTIPCGLRTLGATGGDHWRRQKDPWRTGPPLHAKDPKGRSRYTLESRRGHDKVEKFVIGESRDGERQNRVRFESSPHETSKVGRLVRVEFRDDFPAVVSGIVNGDSKTTIVSLSSDEDEISREGEFKRMAVRNSVQRVRGSDSQTDICSVSSDFPMLDRRVHTPNKTPSTRKNLVKVKLQEREEHEARTNYTTETSKSTIRSKSYRTDKAIEKTRHSNPEPRDHVKRTSEQNQRTQEKSRQSRSIQTESERFRESGSDRKLRKSLSKNLKEFDEAQAKGKFLYPHLFHQDKFHRKSSVHTSATGPPQSSPKRENRSSVRESVSNNSGQVKVKNYAVSKKKSDGNISVAARSSKSFEVDEKNALSKLDIEKLMNKDSLEAYKKKYSRDKLRNNTLSEETPKSQVTSNGKKSFPKPETRKVSNSRSSSSFPLKKSSTVPIVGKFTSRDFQAVNQEKTCAACLAASTLPQRK